MLRKVTTEELSNLCDPSSFSFSTTEEVDPLKETIGQKRALSSLDFGLGIDRHGFNIYILGESGTGKMTSIKTILKEKAKNEPTPNDWCYVYNFRNPDEPKALSMSPGTGITFHKEMEELIHDLRQEIPKIFESKEYEKQRTKIIEDFQKKQKSLFSELEQTAKENDFSLRKTATGLALGPIKKTGETLSEEEFEALNSKAKKKIETIGKELQEKLDDVIRIIRGEEKKVKERMIELERQATLSSVGHRIDEIKSKHQDNNEVIEYLENVKEDILEHFKGVCYKVTAVCSLKRTRLYHTEVGHGDAVLELMLDPSKEIEVVGVALHHNRGSPEIGVVHEYIDRITYKGGFCFYGLEKGESGRLFLLGFEIIEMVKNILFHIFEIFDHLIIILML
jgi:ABC-type dipeptide/oligopeptide/nickel transport system ATPase component